MPLQPGTRLTRDVAAVPGPVDRVHFLDEQRRNRRASWRFSVFALAAAVLSGLPLSILLSPLLFGLTLVIFHGVDLVAPIPASAWNTLEQVARAVPYTWAVMRGNGGNVPWALLTAALVVPGAIVMLAVWVWIRVLFRHVGAGGVLSRLGARPPQRDVIEELQIINIVEEMAIAAGVRPPRVMLIDSMAANVAAVGLSIDDATILVSRGLLALDRDARQAILAHVIGSVSNGDLKIASIVLTVFQTWGLLALVIDTPFGPRSRQAIRQFFTTSRKAWRHQADRLTAGRMLDRLMDGAGLTFDDLFEHTSISEITQRHLARALFVDVPLYLTLGVGAIAAKAAIALFTLLAFGPWLALLWRARRRLADATAVQLTRNPDALARAIREMEGRNVAVEGGAPVSFLFPFWTRWTPDAPPRDDVMAYIVGTQLELDKRLASLRVLGASATDDTVSVTDVAASPTDDRVASGWKTSVEFIGWVALALLLVTACVAFNLITTSLLLWGVWVVLKLVFGGGG
jgi:Zn-dependent protease with chaperone function